LKKGNYDRAVAIAKQAEEEAVGQKRDYEVYKETSDVISKVEAEVARIKRSDVKTSKSDELIEQAHSELKKGNYDRAVAIANRAEEVAVKVKKDYEVYKETADGISSIEARITKLKNAGVKIPKSGELMERAQSELKAGNYIRALELAKQAEEEAVRVKRDYEVYKETTEIISSIEAELAEIKKYGVKLPKSWELLEQAKAELTNHNFDRVREIAEEAKREASERKSAYDLASRSTSETEKKLTELQDKGVIISSELLTKSRQAFDNGSYDEALQLTNELENLITTTEKRYREAQEELKSAETAMEKAQEFGCTVSDIEEKLQNAHQLLAKGAYEESIKASRQIEELIKTAKKDARPDIALKLAKTSFKPDAWQKIDLTIRNNGNATAKEITVEYPKERVEIEDLISIQELPPGAETRITIGLRPIHTGEVPLRTKINSKDLDGKEYKKEETYYITVGKISEAKEKEDKIEIRRGYEVLHNNDLQFGIRIINSSETMMSDVETILDYPRTLFQLKDNVVQTLANIPPNAKRTAKYILTPLGCIHNEKIDATIRYKDHTGKKQTIEMRPKEVHCVCPFLRPKPLREGEFAELANTYESVEEGLSFTGVDAMEIVATVKNYCEHKLYLVGDNLVGKKHIVSLSGESIGEKADYLLTAIIQPNNNLNHVTLRAYSDKSYGLHGFFNETVKWIQHQITSAGSGKKIVPIGGNTVIVSPGGEYYAEGAKKEVTGDQIASGAKKTGDVGLWKEISSAGKSYSKCSSCGKELQGNEKFCPACGTKLE